MDGTSALGRLGKRAVAWLLVVAALLVALKLVIGAVVGIVMTLLAIAVVVLIAGGVLWAMRHL